MKKFGGKITEFVGKITEVKPLYLIAAGLVALLLVGGILVFALVGDDDDGPGGGSDPTLGVGEGDRSRLPGGKSRAQKPAPVVRRGVMDEARRVGRLAVAQARGTIVEPRRVRVRVSAAPKQTTTVNYQLSCFRKRRVKVGRGTYRTKPPSIREIPLPMANAESCVVTVGAQLTRTVGEGRVKVAVLAG